jgi:hypothetical protein
MKTIAPCALRVVGANGQIRAPASPNPTFLLPSMRGMLQAAMLEWCYPGRRP